MKKTYKKLILLAATVMFCALLSIPSFYAQTIIANADYFYTILESGMFTETIRVSGHDYSINCYRIQNHDTYIAVAWGQGADSAPETLSIPETITSNKPTGEDVPYTVVAVARGGFAHCTSATITLPQTVKDIREEAFAYCQNLTSFQFPKDVTVVSPSTFIDCRSLASIYYSSEEGGKTLTNSTITTFGNHSFDSCISLRKIQCPSSATFFGQSCFQRCSKLTRFRFPYDNGLTGDEQNVITVEEYAFADCDALQRVYFDINMLHISDYAFADSRIDLAFYLYGSEIPASLSEKWRNKKITTYSDNEVDYNNVLYDVHLNQIKPAGEAEGYPGLTFSISHEVRPLDNARRNNTQVTIIDATEAATDYAIVSGFEAPEEEDWIEGYYYDGSLTIPDRVKIDNKYYYVKVIDNGAFEVTENEANSPLTEVHFNEHLVQIMNHAFFHSNNIEILDFGDCKYLREISYCLFNEPITPSDYAENGYEEVTDEADTWSSINKNSVMTSITLPNCLEYLGNFAFYNFVNLQTGISFKTNEQQPSKLKIIGDYAFAVYSGKKYGDQATKNNYYNTTLNGVTGPGEANAKVDLVLPNSLDDAEAPRANIFHSYQADTEANINAYVINRVAVNKSAFENQDAIRTVKMEANDAYTPAVAAHDISFGSNAFVRCNNMLRFEASDNICLIGHETFKCCHKLREVFLTTERAKNNHSGYQNGALDGSTVKYPWGVRDNNNDFRDNKKPIFNGGPFEHLVIYLKPPVSGTFNNGGKTTYVYMESVSAAGSLLPNELANSNRTQIPVYTLDWTASGAIKYWHINDAPTDALLDFDHGPRTLNDYNNGYVSLAKNTNNNNYTVTRYFTDGTYSNAAKNFAKTIDFTCSTLNSLTIDKIGEEAFAGCKAMGYYFVLPSSVTIAERAFYRQGNRNRGVRIITFKNGNNIQVNSTNVGTKSFNEIVAAIEAQSDANKAGYCCLPTDVTTVAECAFYNNIFGSIELSNTFGQIVRSAFYTHYSGTTLWGKNQSFTFTNYDGTTTHSKFTAINGGVYYTGSTDKKMLVLQSNGVTGTLTIDSGTKAIGNRAVASCQYSTVVLDGDTTIIYGQAFANCLNLETITNTSQIKYINASVNSPDVEINNVSGYYDQNGSAGTGAFSGCAKLHTDVSQMTSLVKIGESAFSGCKTLMTGITPTNTYSFYTYASGGSETSVDITNKTIMDLSTLSNLVYLGKSAFSDCNIDYAILPNTTEDDYSKESKFTCGNGAVFKAATIKLCGETAHQADQSSQNSALKPKTHYPTAALCGDYNKLYYRIHSDSDVITTNLTTPRHYWTAVNTGNANEVKIILFNTKADVTAWLSADSDGDGILNIDEQCHLFPES